MTAAKLSKDLEKAQAQFEAFDDQVKAISSDVNQNLPVQKVEDQTQLSTKEIQKEDGLVLTPERTLGSKEPFNEAHRKKYEFAKEPVRFIAENHEVLGEKIDIWTKGFPGVAAEYWRVPVNKVVIGPRYLAEQISRKSYIRLKTEDRVISQDGMGSYTGQLVASHKVQRLDARPAEGFNRASKFN